MSSGPGSLAKANNLSEIAQPLATGSGIVTAATRQAAARANIGVPEALATVTADAAEINKLDGMTTSKTELNLLTGLTATAAQINAVALPATYAAVTATANGLTTGLIANGVRRTTITSANATDAVTLPGIAANSLPIGYTIVGRVTANGCEMLTPATTNETINAVDSDGTNQLDIAANTGFIASVISTTGWDVLPFATTVAPDND